MWKILPSRPYQCWCSTKVCRSLRPLVNTLRAAGESLWKIAAALNDQGETGFGMKAAAKKDQPTKTAANLKRTESAIRSKAQAEGISLNRPN